ncbi:MAG: S-layer homology domain-containing protein, partial [Defluviitaleaceae bacterium]|nr:S-layer homology domain-containing protein [Defluviitaleaceae bacterium]
MMNKRILSALLSVVMVLGLLPAAVFANDYRGHWAESSIDRAIEMGWFARNDSGIYRPNAPVTRAEFVTMINRMQGNTELAGLSAFSDVSAGDWYYTEFQKAVAAGFITGVANRLFPTDNITRNEATAIFARISGINTISAVMPASVRDSGTIPAWARAYVSAAINQGLITGSDGSFNGGNNLTRAETAVLLERLYDNIRVFAFAGEYNIESAGSVMLAASGVTLKNTVVSGNVTVTPAIGNGTVTLDTVTVRGRLDVQGGGMNSVIIINSSINEIVINKDEVRVVLEEGTEVGSVVSNSEDGLLFVDEGASASNINVTSQAEGFVVVIAGGAEVESISVAAEGAFVIVEYGAEVGTLSVTGDEASVVVAGEVGSLAVTGDDSSVLLQEGAEIGETYVTGDGSSVVVEDGADTGSLAVTGEGSSLSIEDGARVGELTMSESTTSEIADGAEVESVTTVASDGTETTETPGADTETGTSNETNNDTNNATSNDDDDTPPTVAVTSVTVNAVTVCLESTNRLTAAVLPANATNRTLAWEIVSYAGLTLTSATTLARNGLYTAGDGPGQVTVMAVSNNSISGAAVITVTDVHSWNASTGACDRGACQALCPDTDLHAWVDCTTQGTCTTCGFVTAAPGCEWVSGECQRNSAHTCPDHTGWNSGATCQAKGAECATCKLPGETVPHNLVDGVCT